jgi:hypothetical protein
MGLMREMVAPMAVERRFATFSLLCLSAQFLDDFIVRMQYHAFFFPSLYWNGSPSSSSSTYNEYYPTAALSLVMKITSCLNLYCVPS